MLQTYKWLPKYKHDYVEQVNLEYVQNVKAMDILGQR